MKKGLKEISVGSVMDDIAEGFERGTRKEFIQFLDDSEGSCGEMKSQFYKALNQCRQPKNSH